MKDKLILQRRCLHQKGPLNEGVSLLDVTIKSGGGIGKWVAPTWGMVRRYKSHTLSQQDYTIQYNSLLNEVGEKFGEYLLHRHAFDDVYEVQFGCYCRDNTFCHTHLLIDWLVLNLPQHFIDGRLGY